MTPEPRTSDGWDVFDGWLHTSLKRNTHALYGIGRRTKRRSGSRETLYEPVTPVTTVTDAAVRCHGWCPIRHGRRMMGDEAWLVGILVSAQAEAAKPRTLVVVPVFHAVEAYLVLEQVSQEPGKAPGRQGLPTDIIDPRPIMRVEPAVLVRIAIALIQLVGAPDIDDCQGVPW